MVSLVLFIVNAGVGIRSSKDLTRTSMYWFSTPDTYNVDSNSILLMVYDLMSKNIKLKYKQNLVLAKRNWAKTIIIT